MFSKSTKVFKHIIMKYNKKKKDTRQAKQPIYKRIENNLQKLETEENENEFIIREVRKNIELKRTILFRYGTKAIKHYDDFQKYKIKTKLDKKALFNPLWDLNLSDNHKRTNSSNVKDDKKRKNFISHKIINFPSISEIDKKPINNEKNLYDSISIIKKLENSFRAIDAKSEIKNETTDNFIAKQYTPSFKIKKKEIIDKYYNTFNNISLINKKVTSYKILNNEQNTPLKSETGYTTSYKDSNYINRFKTKNNFRINQNYLNYLQKIKDKFDSKEKRQKKYFENNKYGCDEFKLKYNYLTQKFFKKFY